MSDTVESAGGGDAPHAPLEPGAGDPSSAPAMTADPGTYVLVVEAPSEGRVEIGKLGTVALEGGWLLYVGSAFGPGGLRARVRRHLGSAKTLHWHVDYLLEAVDVAEVWWTHDPEKREEPWIEALRAAPGARVPLRGFGAGDCGCAGHLVRLPRRPEPELLRGGADDASGPSIARAPASTLAPD